jgi:hypothetical protein
VRKVLTKTRAARGTRRSRASPSRPRGVSPRQILPADEATRTFFARVRDLVSRTSPSADDILIASEALAIWERVGRKITAEEAVEKFVEKQPEAAKRYGLTTTA